MPYIIVPPGSRAGSPGQTPRLYDGFVEHVDLAPTILDYAGIPQPGELPGRSLRPVVEGTGDLLPLAGVLCDHASRRDKWVRSKCLRTARYKYIFSGADRPVELYDLEEDPQELVNVAGEASYRSEVTRHAELLLHRLMWTEQTPWNRSLSARTPQSVDPFGLSIRQQH